jgi:hypothetical protein
LPQPIKHSKFVKNPEYDEAKDLAKSIEEARAFLNRELSAIDKIEDITLQLIIIFSLIDRLAQEQANYPLHGFQDVFCQFVLKHQKQCDYMEEVEPVTLYYRVENLIEESILIPNFPPKKVISLDSLGYLYSVPVKNVLTSGKTEEILEYVKTKNGFDYAEKVAREHKLISLLYRMRSKAVHEMSGLGESMGFHDELQPKEPYYRDVGRAYVQDDYWVHDDVVELVIPNVFVRNILSDCIDGYLTDCATNKRFPFSNNNMTRIHRLSWYDK